jgi:hypothetical protein
VYLNALPKLQDLNLWCTGLPADGLPRLAGLGQLRHLRFRFGHADGMVPARLNPRNEAPARSLRAALPNLKINE